MRLCHSPTFRVGRDSQLSGGWERRFTTLPGAIHNSGPLIHNLIHKFWQGDGSNGDLCREIAVLTVRRARKKTSSTPSTTSRPKSRRGGDPGEYVVFATYVSWPPHGILSMTSIARRLGRIQEAAQAPFHCQTAARANSWVGAQILSRGLQNTLVLPSPMTTAGDRPSSCSRSAHPLW